MARVRAQIVQPTPSRFSSTATTPLTLVPPPKMTTRAVLISAGTGVLKAVVLLVSVLQNSAGD